MQNYCDDDSDLTAGNCSGCDGKCTHCIKFTEGDRVELTTIGVLILGKNSVVHGTVISQSHNERKLRIIHVKWDGYPDRIIGKVNPQYIQKIGGESIVLL